MRRIRLASAGLILICLGAVSHLFGESLGRQSGSGVANRFPAGRSAAEFQQSVDAYLVAHREVIWHVDPFGGSEFGSIPTQWTTRPQLLPLTWDVRTVFATGGADDAKVGRGDFSPRVKMARAD